MTKLKSQEPPRWNSKTCTRFSPCLHLKLSLLRPSQWIYSKWKIETSETRRTIITRFTLSLIIMGGLVESGCWIFWKVTTIFKDPNFFYWILIVGGKEKSSAPHFHGNKLFFQPARGGKCESPDDLSRPLPLGKHPHCLVQPGRPGQVINTPEKPNS